MASSWTHAIGAVAVASLLMPRAAPPRVWLAVAVAAVIPDIDAIGRPFGRGDLSWLGGHRALTHSLTFAATVGLLLLTTLRLSTRNRRERLLTWLAFALAIASHGALDSLTAYGEGIAFLAPWSERRYRAPWRLLGDGIVRDTVAFVLLFILARTVMIRRGITLPRALRIFDSTA